MPFRRPGALRERIETDSGHGPSSRHEAAPMIGFTIMILVENSDLGLVRRAENVRVGG